MKKIVVNQCFGGFGLSDEAIKWMKARGLELDYKTPRDHPILVECVETLKEESFGNFAELAIVEIPDDVGNNWHIHEYDGSEHVAENYRIWG